MTKALVVRAAAAAAATLLLTAGCGSSDTGDGAAGGPSPSADATQSESAATAKAQDAGLPEDPCAVLSLEQVGTVLSTPGAGTGAVGGTGPGGGVSCEWTDGQGTTFLEFLAYDVGGEQYTSDLLLQLRGADGEASTLQVLDFGPTAAIGGPEDGDAVVQWLGPAGLYQLRMYSVGAAADPASQWSTLQRPLEDLALAVNAAG